MDRPDDCCKNITCIGKKRNYHKKVVHMWIVTSACCFACCHDTVNPVLKMDRKLWTAAALCFVHEKLRDSLSAFCRHKIRITLHQQFKTECFPISFSTWTLFRLTCLVTYSLMPSQPPGPCEGGGTQFIPPHSPQASSQWKRFGRIWSGMSRKSEITVKAEFWAADQAHKHSTAPGSPAEGT